MFKVIFGKHSARFAAVFFLLGMFLFALLPATKAQTKRALVISLDGLDARYLHDADKYKLKIPTLRRLMANGVTARGMFSVYPSITYPNHTSLVTGALPSKHGIFGNSVFEPPVSKQSGAAHWFARDIKADTLWDAAKRAGLTVGMVSFPVAGGAGDWNVPEIWQPGGKMEDHRRVIAENARPRGLVEEIENQFPDIYKNTNDDEGDDARTRFAEYIIAEKRPHLMLVHLYDLDHFQHDYGPFTTEAFAMLEKTDEYVARLLNALEKARTIKETTVFITSDHGFKPITKQIHPGVLLRRAGLVVATDEKDERGRERAVVNDWKAAVYVTGAACAIYLREVNDRATLKQLRETFKPLEKQPDSGIFRVLEAKDLRKLGSNTRAALMLKAADDFTFGGNYAGEPIVESRSRGMHGYLPTRPDYFASFIASGANVGGRGVIDYLNMTDAGATVAAALGLKLRDASGRAISLQTEKTRNSQD